MAVIIPLFELQLLGNGSVTSETWHDVTAQISGGVIPSGKHLWLGYSTFISEDKSLIFELRPNLTTKSAGNTTDTQLRAFTSVPGGESRDVDTYLGGIITWLAPVSVASTGVEKLWLRIRSNTGTNALWNYIIYYTLY